jgi:hypothetical protein
MLGRIFRGLLILLVVLVLAIGALFAGARFHDGPLGAIPGGPLAAGELVTAPQSDWKFAKDIPEIEMQLAYENTSRTTWILVADDGTGYIPCSLKFPPGKRWYKAADQNGAAVLRIQGKRYPVTMTRVQDETQRSALGQVTVKKYPAAARGGSLADSWFFKLESRTDAAAK